MVARALYHWTWVALLIVCYLGICTRTAFRMARTGRSFWLWLIISVFLTSIPGTFVLMRDQLRGMPQRRRRPPASRPPEGGPLRCSHCGKLTRPDDLDRSGGVTTCPHCGMTVNETELA
ncbi:MAG: hypothetical protein WBF17_09805 [Phycisphaerae bacterium]